MIKNIFLYISLLVPSLVSAQSKKTTVATPKTSQHLNVFEQAVKAGDANTAIIALNYYLTEQVGYNNYVDTLAMLYMQQGAIGQCYYWVQKSLQAKPDDTNILELKGICLEKLQQPKEAIELFEKLTGANFQPQHLSDEEIVQKISAAIQKYH